jgi:hypothetical protein
MSLRTFISNPSPLTQAIGYLLAFTGYSAGEILVNLDPSTALYDSAVKGVVNDGGFGPGSAGNLSGVPALGAAHLSSGFTFNIAFTPADRDLIGTILLIEIGGTANGSGLYLVDGVPTLISKQGSSDRARPDSLHDTALPEIALQSPLGKLVAGTAYSYSASWNHQGTLELNVKPEGGEVISKQFTISGNFGDWSGNDTLSVATVGRNNLGGQSGSNAGNDLGAPFDVDITTSFTGTVSRALFWNSQAVSPIAPTAPIIHGFEITRLPTAGNYRFHWSVSEGAVSGYPTSLAIKSGQTVVHTPGSLEGFIDLTSSAETEFTLEAINDLGLTTHSSTVEVETSWSQAIHAAAPIAWFRFNEKSGSGLIVDSAENAAPHNGKPTNTPVSGFAGFVDGAARFPGTSGIVTKHILNPGNLEKGFSVETLVKRFNDTTRSTRVIVGQQDLDGTGRVILNSHSTGRISTNLGQAIRKDADATLAAEGWAHLVMVVDVVNLEIRWYLDGQWVGSTKDGLNPDGSSFDPNFLLESSTGAWTIAAPKSLTQDFWNGEIDDIAIYDYLLDDPDNNPQTADSKVQSHREAWWSFSKGLLEFSTANTTVTAGDPATFHIRVGADVTSATLAPDGIAIPLVNGAADVTVTPTSSGIYQLTTHSPAGSETRTLELTALQRQAPTVRGFEASRLETPNRTRLHWRADQGEAPNPTTITLKDGDTVLHVSQELNGFVDVESSASVFTLEAANSTGTTLASASVAAENLFSEVVRADSPEAWFRFNEVAGSTLIIDSAANEAPHNGTPTTTPVSGAGGFVDGAAKFTGSGGILTDFILNPGDLETGFTVEAIVRRDPNPGNSHRILVAQQDQNGTGRTIVQITGDGLITTALPQSIRKDADTRIGAEQWAHVVMVADIINQEIRWYVDGVAAGTTKDGVNPDGTTFDPNFLLEQSTGAWSIGVHKTLTQNYFFGEIDELAIYKSLLDDPNADGDLQDSRVEDHRDAWWNMTSGVIHLGTDESTIGAGDTATLTIRTGPDITAITLDPDGGTFTPVNGTTTIPLRPTATTTYQVTLTGPNGSIERTITIVVDSPGEVPSQNLQVTSHAIVDGNLVVTFRGAVSTTYAVKGSSDLITFEQDLGTATTDTTGQGAFSHPIDPLRDRQFLRIETIPAP